MIVASHPQAFDQRPEDALDTNANRDYLQGPYDYDPEGKFFPLIVKIEAAQSSSPIPNPNARVSVSVSVSLQELFCAVKQAKRSVFECLTELCCVAL